MDKTNANLGGIRGLTPAQIRRAINGTKAPEPEVIKLTALSKKPSKPVAAPKRSTQGNGILFDLPYSTGRICSRVPTPAWFELTQKPEISIIVPMYKADIERFVAEWKFESTKIELIFIDDCCPDDSKARCIKAWTARGENTPVGRIYYSTASQGYGACCNFGAEVASGSMLFFVNPSVSLKPNWLSAMTRLLRKQDVGQVTGLLTNQDERLIASAGKEWLWSEGMFCNVGVSAYKNNPITKPFRLDNCPADLMNARDCEGATSDLMGMRRDLFIELGGFNPNLFSQTWADADLSCRVREGKLKVICQPLARGTIPDPVHDARYYKHGKAHFDNKWIASGRLAKLVKNAGAPKPDVKTILIQRQAANGDVLLAAALAPALKQKYPNCSIKFATECPEILKDNPWIDKVVEIGEDFQFDLFINLDMAYEYRPLTNILNAYADVAGVKVSDCKMALSTEDVQDLPPKYVVIHAGKTLWAGRNWTTLKFDQLSARLKAAGHVIVTVGTTYDHKPVCTDLDLRGQTTIQQMAEVISRSSLFIGIDSMPMHIAQAFDISGVAFFGSVKPETRIVSKRMRPVTAVGLKCLGCHHRKSLPCVATTTCDIGTPDCINTLSVDAMFKAITEQLTIDT